MEGEVVFAMGKVNIRDDRASIILDDIKQIKDIYFSIKAINIDLKNRKKEVLDELKAKLQKFPGRTPVFVNVNTKANKSVQIKVGENYQVSPNEILMNEIKDLVGKEHFSLTL